MALKLTRILILSLLIISISIFIVAIKGVAINVQIIEEALTLNENYYSGLITVIISVIALALPLAISAISANQQKKFFNNEIAESLYKQIDYKLLKWSVFLLIVLLIPSYFKQPKSVYTIILSISVVLVLVVFYRFIAVVEKYISNFPTILIEQEKENIDRILRG